MRSHIERRLRPCSGCCGRAPAIDRYLYRERHLVENVFLQLERFRRIEMRFEKLAESFLVFNSGKPPAPFL